MLDTHDTSMVAWRHGQPSEGSTMARTPKANVPNLKPELPSNEEAAPVIDWGSVAELLRATPGKWMRLEHNYASDRAARVSIQRAAERHGFDYKAQASKRQANGGLGLFVRWIHTEKKEG
jgi:hypothetical protein